MVEHSRHTVFLLLSCLFLIFAVPLALNAHFSGVDVNVLNLVFVEEHVSFSVATKAPNSQLLNSSIKDVYLLTKASSIDEINSSPRLQPKVISLGSDYTRDSQVWKFDDFNDPRKYVVCAMTNVCQNASHTLFIVSNETLRAQLKDMVNHQACFSKPLHLQHKLCRCFLWLRFDNTNHPAFVDSEDLNIQSMQKLSGNSWLFDTWVGKHHIGHFAETAILFHSINLQASSYGYLPVSRLIMNQLTKPFLEHERFFYNVSTSVVTPHLSEDPIWKDDIHSSSGGGFCFEQLTHSPISALIANDQHDAHMFRARAYNFVNLTLSHCPPPQVVILRRTKPAGATRRIMNDDKIAQLLTNKYRVKNITIASIDETTSSLAQVKLFATTGLLISSHSSQLVNMAFSQPNSAVVEVAPTFYGLDFFWIGHNMGLFYQMIPGGQVPGVSQNNITRLCIQRFKNCVRLGPQTNRINCFLQQTWIKDKCIDAPDHIYDAFAKSIKPFEFFADIDDVDFALSVAINHLHASCEGKWPGIEDS